MIQSIESFLPYRDEAVEVFVNIATYMDSLASRTVIHRFFEQINPYMHRPESVSRYREWDWDNFRFLVHELFLYAVASFIRHERFESAAFLMTNDYYVLTGSRSGPDQMVSFVEFRSPIRSLEDRNRRLQLRRLSLRADILRERCKHVGIEFRHLMQADFVLFLRSRLEKTGRMMGWWPETLLFSHQGPFEVFARSRSKAYFDRVKVLLGIDEKNALASLFEEFAKNTQYFPHWQYESFDPISLIGFNDLSTKP